jgi:hypothetical protein
MKKKVLIKDLSVSSPCWGCSATGQKDMGAGLFCQCPLCHGTGRYIEKHFIIGDGKIAFDCDSLK